MLLRPGLFACLRAESSKRAHGWSLACAQCLPLAGTQVRVECTDTQTEVGSKHTDLAQVTEKARPKVSGF